MKDNEYELATQAVKANKRLVAFRYLLTLLAFLSFMFVAYELLHLRADNKRLLENMRSEINIALEKAKQQNEETRLFTTCLLRTSIEQRSQQYIDSCKQQSQLENGTQPQDFTPKSTYETSSLKVAAPSSSQYKNTSSYSNSTTPPTAAPSNTSQAPLEPGIIKSVLDNLTLVAPGLL